jgi:hypothetical protein
MNKEFIPYEQALDLKELGFDEPCILLYRGLDTQPVCQIGYEFKTEKNSDYNDETNYWLTVPTFSQAFRWFREKYGYLSNIHDFNGNFKATLSGNCNWLGSWTKTYEEAELDCLKKLIEIVKNK